MDFQEPVDSVQVCLIWVQRREAWKRIQQVRQELLSKSKLPFYHKAKTKNKCFDNKEMKEYVVLLSLVLLLAGIVWNYNTGNRMGTNLIVGGIVILALVMLFGRNKEVEGKA